MFLEIHVTHIDTACVLLEINGYRILTDPTLDHAGGLYHHGFGAFSRKTDVPAVNEIERDTVDLILLSHHQHKDNFDHKGKELARKVGKIISTKVESRAIQGVTGLEDWEQCSLETHKVPNLHVTAAPAQHHP